MTWVVYDVSDDRQRERVARACKLATLQRVQKSVFLGDLEPSRRDELALELEATIDLTTDSVYVFPMCRTDFRQIALLGQAFDPDRVSGELRRLFF